MWRQPPTVRAPASHDLAVTGGSQYRIFHGNPSEILDCSSRKNGTIWLDFRPPWPHRFHADVVISAGVAWHLVAGMSEQFTRYRMQIDLRRRRLPTTGLPTGYRWIPWRALLLERHAQVKWQCFRNELDGRIFPCLSQIEGCRRLMHEISTQPDFCADATWLVVHQPDLRWPAVDCAVIQGIARSGGIGAVQNVGVLPEYRGQGLGRAIVLQSLRGFQYHGMATSSLEVTAVNEHAVRLYHSVGFEVTDVLYRDVEADSSGTSEVSDQTADVRERPMRPH